MHQVYTGIVATIAAAIIDSRIAPNSATKIFFKSFDQSHYNMLRF